MPHGEAAGLQSYRGTGPALYPVLTGVNTKHRGIESELAVAHALAKAGYSVAFPFGENCPYDMIVELPDGRLMRLQVRTAAWKNETLKVSLRQVSKNYSRPLDLSRIDAFVLWDGQCPYTVLVPDLGGQIASFSLRRSPTKHGQKARCHAAADFIGFSRLFGEVADK